MVSFSLCMIVRDEEAVLARCLESCRGIFDEIIIVDTGSSDKTLQIAREFASRVESFEWCYDFAAARNFSFSLASSDFIMWLDADDVILERDRKKLIALKKTLDSDVDIVLLPYNAASDGERATFTYFRERLIRRQSGQKWQGCVHEAIALKGKIVRGNAAITHRKQKKGDRERNLDIYRRFISSGQKMQPRDRFYYARELMFCGLYAEAEAEFALFLKEGGGLRENILEAHQNRADCLIRLAKKDDALNLLLASLAYGPPRAEIACKIATHFADKGDYSTAIFWFETALKDKSDGGLGFVSIDHRTIIPCLMLCVCHYRLGNKQKALTFHKKAQKLCPNHPSVIYNNQFF